MSAVSRLREALEKFRSEKNRLMNELRDVVVSVRELDEIETALRNIYENEIQGAIEDIVMLMNVLLMRGSDRLEVFRKTDVEFEAIVTYHYVSIADTPTIYFVREYFLLTRDAFRRFTTSQVLDVDGCPPNILQLKLGEREYVYFVLPETSAEITFRVRSGGETRLYQILRTVGFINLIMNLDRLVEVARKMLELLGFPDVKQKLVQNLQVSTAEMSKLS